MHHFRLFVTVIIMAFLATPAHSQKLTVSPDVIDDDLGYMKVLGQDETGYYFLQSNLSFELQRDHVGLRNRKYKLSYFGKDLHLHWTKSLVSHLQDGNVEGVIFFNEKATVLTSTWNKSSATFSYYIDTYNADGTFAITQLKLGECSIEKGSDAEKPQLLLSNSKNKLGIYFDEIRSSDQVLHLLVTDTSFRLTARSECVLSYAQKDMEITSTVLSDDDQFCLLAQLRLRDAEKEKRRLWLYRLFYVGRNASACKEFVINEAERQMTEASLVIDKINKTAVVTGFYADKGSFAGTGILFSSIPLSDPTTITKNNFTINGDAQSKLVGERNSGNAMGLFNYPIQKIIVRNDGGAVIVAEAQYLSEYSYYDYYTQSFNRRIEYHFDNIVLMSVSANGTIDWSQVIRKDQSSVDDEGLYASFAYAISPDAISIFLNGDIGRNNEVVLFSIDYKGSLSTKKITRQGENISLIPKSGKQVDESVLIVPGINKKRVYLFKIEF